MKVKIFILILLALLAGCVQNGQVKGTGNAGKANRANTSSNASKKLQVFFYYETGCPNCRMIEPYMKLLKKELVNVDFHFCNWDDHENWSGMEKEVYSEVNPYGFPAVVVVNKTRKTVFIGWKDIGINFTAYLKKLGFRTPRVFYNRTSYNVTECLNCHAKRHIKPPSRYSCTYCCHMSRINSTS